MSALKKTNCFRDRDKGRTDIFCTYTIEFDFLEFGRKTYNDVITATLLFLVFGPCCHPIKYELFQMTYFGLQFTLVSRREPIYCYGGRKNNGNPLKQKLAKIENETLAVPVNSESPMTNKVIKRFAVKKETKT